MARSTSAASALPDRANPRVAILRSWASRSELASWKGLLARLRRGNYRAEHGASYYDWSFGDLKRSLSKAGLRVSAAVGLNWLPFMRDSDNGLIGPLSTIEGASGVSR